MEIYLVLMVEEVRHHKEGRDGHGYVRGEGGAPYTPAESEQEQRGENGVQYGTQYVGEHGLARIACSAHHIVVRECQVNQHHSGNNPLHELAGIGNGCVGSAECTQDGVQEYEESQHIGDADNQGQHHRVAENKLGTRFVLLSQYYGNTCRGSGTYQHAESAGKGHDRKCDCYTGYDVGVVNGVSYYN